MAVVFPQVRVGDGIRHGAVTVFPLFVDSERQLDYSLSDEAIASGDVVVEEVSEAGSVPELSVENKSGARVLFLESEELVGAKQNRVLNVTVLVAAGSKIKLPVSCVEQGRWSFRSRTFQTSQRTAPAAVRHALKASVAQSAAAGCGRRSDQGRIWDVVAEQHRRLGVQSPTMAMADVFETHGRQVEAHLEQLSYVSGAAGLAIAVGGKLRTLDLFDQPATCAKVWRRFVSGAAIDALEAGEEPGRIESADVERWLERLNGLAWQQAAAVGEGQELRAATDEGDHASALVVDGVLIHGSLVCAV